MKTERSVSELLSAMILAVIIVSGLGLLLITITSQPPPVLLPAADFKLTIDQPVLQTNPESMPKIHIHHIRGDSFFLGPETGKNPFFKVTVDGKEYRLNREPAYSENYFTLVKGTSNEQNSDYYSVGDELIAPYQGSKPENVQFIFKDLGGTEYLLWGSGDLKGDGTVSFYPSVREPDIGETVTFTDTSTFPAISWSWDFGDGTKASDQNPSHAYVVCGQKTVTLTISNGIEEKSTSRILNVQTPQADFSAIPAGGSAPLTVIFTDTSTHHPMAWSWTFGDGTTAIVQNPTHTFTTPSDNTVTLTAGTPPCTTTKTKVITVTECIPITDLDFSPVTAITNQPVQFITSNFSGTPPVTYLWDFGDGLTSTEKNPPHTFTTSGDYLVSLNATNCAGSVTVHHTVSVIAHHSCEKEITATAGPGGSISPPGTTTVICGNAMQYMITADTCYAISSVTVDGTPLTGPFTNPYTYPFSSVQASHTIDATFKPTTYTITATSGPGGTISPAGSKIFSCGDTIQYVITTNTCYNLSSVTVDGTPLTGPFSSPYSYKFSNVQASHTINAIFSPTTFNITTSAGPGGAISPSGTIITICGSDQIITVTANTCSNISSVTVDGTPLAGPFSSPYSYKFSNVQASHTINATFSPVTYPITTSAGAGGTVSPSGIIQTACGSDKNIIITANSCYTISSITVDGNTVTGPFASPYTFTFTNVQAPHTINVTFIQTTFTISASTGIGGTISPAGSVPVPCMESRSFTITPSAGYFIQNVVVDGSSVGNVSSYSFTGVTANHVIQASFGGLDTCMTITGRVTNSTTGTGIGGVVIMAYKEGTTILAGSAITLGDGSYIISNLDNKPALKYDVYCFGSSAFLVVSPNPLWTLLNPGNYCTNTANFTVRYGGLNPGDFLYNAPKKAQILSGGSVEFTVATPVNYNAYITVNSNRYYFNVGDTVTITVNSAQTTGDVIYMGNVGGGYSISTFAFSDVIVHKNNVLLARGTVNEIFIPRTGSFSSTLVLDIPRGQNKWTSFDWGGVSVFPDSTNSQGVTIWNLRPDSSGILNINLNNVYAQGHGDQYLLY